MNGTRLLIQMSLLQFWDGTRHSTLTSPSMPTIPFVDHSFFGMIPVAYAADKFGRRKTIQIGAAIYMYDLPVIYLRDPLTVPCYSLGGALQTGARNMDMMLAGRFFAGACFKWLPRRCAR